MAVIAPASKPVVSEGSVPMQQQQPQQQAAASAVAAAGPQQPAAVGNVHYASASLYVGDLTSDVEEATLYEVFSTVGPVSSIRVCRDANSHKSLGYAYVNYHTVQDAERALESLNYTPVKGQACRIMWSHRDPSLRRSGNGNLFVKNLDKMVDNKALYDTFSLFGRILSCKIATDELGKPLGYGFVHYETEQSAREAITRINGMEMGKKKIFVGPFQSRSERGDSRDEFFTNLYVKHLPDEWDDDILRSVFEKFGSITSLAISSDSRGRRFAFVNYDSRDSAKGAVNDLHGRRTTATGMMTAEEEIEAEKREHEEAVAAAARGSSEGAEDKTAATTTEDGATAATGTSKVESSAAAAGSAVSDEQQSTATAASDAAKQQEQQQQQQGGPTTPANNDGLGTVTSAAKSSASSSAQLSPAKALLADVPENRLYVQRAMSRQERVNKLKDAFATNSQPQERDGGRSYAVNLYVKNLQEDVDDEALRETFNMFGTVTSARVMRHDNGVSKGFGFVCFAFPEDATKAVTAMHLKVFRGKPLYVGLAEKREYRTARLQQRYRVGPRAAPSAPAPAALPPAVHHMPHAAAPMMAVAPGASHAPPAAGFHGPPQPQMFYNHPLVPGQVPRPDAAYAAAPPSVWRQAPAARPSQPQQQPPQQPQFGAIPATPDFPWNPAAAARGPMVPQQPQPQQQPQQQPLHPQAQVQAQQQSQQPRRNFAEGLAAAHPQMQKQMLGEKLFPLVSRSQPILAGKITGMMLEMDNAELLSLLDNEAHLRAKVDEALAVLQRHNQAVVVAAEPGTDVGVPAPAGAAASGAPAQPPQPSTAAGGF